MKPKHKYDLKIYNGRIRFYIDGYLFLSIIQLDLKGHYAYKDDSNLYGIDFYIAGENNVQTTMETYYKTKENWLEILKLIDKYL